MSILFKRELQIMNIKKSIFCLEIPCLYFNSSCSMIKIKCI